MSHLKMGLKETLAHGNTTNATHFRRQLSNSRIVEVFTEHLVQYNCFTVPHQKFTRGYKGIAAF